MSRNTDDRDYGELIDATERLRQVLLTTGDHPVPAVLSNDVIFKSVFCFILDADQAVQFLEELGKSAVDGWSTLVEMEPLEFVQKIRMQPASANENTAVIVLFLYSATRLSVMVNKTLNIATEERVRTTSEVSDSGDSIGDAQQGLNKALISCVHLGKLMHSRNPEERAICAEQNREMLAAFSIVAHLLYDLGDYEVLSKMIISSEKAFQFADEVSETVLDLQTDVSQRFFPEMIKTLVAEDREQSCSLPFRMYWHYMYVQTVKEVSRGEEWSEWRIDQHLSNANHYCADNGTLYHGGRYALMCWLLYVSSLVKCEEYATAELILEILKMDHMKTMMTSKFAADCMRLCTERAEGTKRKEHLLYYVAPSNIQFADSPPEKTVWHSIYDDPAVRKYCPRHLPDYVDICRQLKKCDDPSSDTVQSLVLQSVGPLIDLAYQPKKPTKQIRADTSVNIFGGSVNESLDVQSHVDAAASEEEVPDIDMMMAVTPSTMGLDVALDSSATSPRYAYLMNVTTGERQPSFDLLVDSFPIALNRVAEFVADTDFAEQYEILSVAIHGPAIATKIRRGGDTVLSYDHVPAFWIQTWPDVAREWITRPRRFGWPSAAVVSEIVHDGILLVAACHRSSADPENEWRISFTMAERTLVDTLSDVQRLAYLYAKLVWMFSLKPKSSSFLVSYHLKNALLWLCEERPSEFWRGDNLVVCVRDIFRWLHDEISNSRLRHYFIAADSMIPSWVESTVDILQSLSDIIDNVFQVRQI